MDSLSRRRTRIAIITTISDIYVRGPRKLAAFLRMHGFEVTQVFMPMQPTYTGIGPHCVSRIPDRVIDQLLELIADCDVIGFSAMTDYMPMVRQLGAACRLRFPEATILLGGVHAIQAPEYAIREEYLDGICTGEGELPLLELMRRIENGADITQTRGFWFRSSAGVVRNARGDYVDLDALPFVDFDGGYIAMHDRIEPVREAHLRQFFGSTYWTDRSRGCPFHCAFCIHSRLKAEGNNPVRWSSMKYFVAETGRALEKYPWFNSIYFNDETFTAQSVAKLREFAEVYRENIGLPFSTYVDPFSCSPEKLDLMFEAGLVKLKMGIQSGSRRIMSEYFDRSANYDRIAELTRHIAAHWSHRRSLPVYDVITGIPWSTPDDANENFAALARLGPPFFCQVFTLSYYPGSKLFNRAVADGFIGAETLPQQNHVATAPTLANCLLQLLGCCNVPQWLVDRLIRSGLAASTRRMPLLFKLTNGLGMLRRIVRQVLADDSTLMPERMVRILQRLGRCRTRSRFDARASARDIYLDGYRPPTASRTDPVLIAASGTRRILGNFERSAPQNEAAPPEGESDRPINEELPVCI